MLSNIELQGITNHQHVSLNTETPPRSGGQHMTCDRSFNRLWGSHQGAA